MAKELARLEVSYPKRIFGMGLLLFMGVFLLIVVASQPVGLTGWSIMLGAFGLGMIYYAWRFWRSTSRHLILNKNGVFDDHGLHLCALEDIRKIERGFFAFRPSGGFSIATKTPVRRGWAPGLWWSFGKQIGIGGATPRPAGKQFADILAVMLTERGAEIIAMNEPPTPEA